MSAFKIYLLLQLGNLPENILPVIVCFGLVIGLIIGFCILMEKEIWEDRNSRPNLRKALKITGIIMIVSIIFCAIIPTKKDLMTIYVGSYITQQKDINKLPANAAKIVNKLFTDYTKKGE